MKNFYLLIISILISNFAIANNISLKSEDITTSFNIPMEFENLNQDTQLFLFEKTKSKFFNSQMSEDKGKHKIWIENDYTNKIDNKFFPNLILIRTNNENFLSRDQFVNFINTKLENQNLNKIWIDGYTIYTSVNKVNFNVNDYFINGEKNIFKHQMIILLPNNRFSTVDLFLDEKLTISELENFLKISPRLAIQDLQKIYGEKEINSILDENFTEKINEYLVINGYYHNVIDQITTINAELINEIISNVLIYQKNDVTLNELNKNFDNSIANFNIKTQNIKDEYSSSYITNFEYILDGRYKYFLRKVEKHIQFLFNEGEKQKKSINDISNYIKNNPDGDLTNVIGKLYFSLILKDAEKSQYLINSQKNNIVSSNSSNINILSITSEIYQIYINYLEFLVNAYDYDKNYISLLYMPVYLNNNSIIDNLDSEFQLANKSIIKYEEYILNILKKLRNNDKILEIFSKINDNSLRHLEKLEILSRKYKSFHQQHEFVINYSDYSIFFDDFLILDDAVNQLIYDISLIKEENRVLSFEYSEEISKL